MGELIRVAVSAVVVAAGFWLVFQAGRAAGRAEVLEAIADSLPPHDAALWPDARARWWWMAGHVAAFEAAVGEPVTHVAEPVRGWLFGGGR